MVVFDFLSSGEKAKCFASVWGEFGIGAQTQGRSAWHEAGSKNFLTKKYF